MDEDRRAILLLDVLLAGSKQEHKAAKDRFYAAYTADRTHHPRAQFTGRPNPLHQGI